jgi:hypothetical protein
LSILSYLRTAEHITGHARYAEAAERLIRDHAYALNVLIPKTNAGPGSGNQSDDEMAFMNFYCLLKYEKDVRLRQVYGLAFYHRWLIEQPERNPLFNFIYASSVEGLVFTGDAGDQFPQANGWWNRRILLGVFRWTAVIGPSATATAPTSSVYLLSSRITLAGDTGSMVR